MNSCCNTWTVVVTQFLHIWLPNLITNQSPCNAVWRDNLHCSVCFEVSFFSVRGCSPDCRRFAVKSIDHGGTLFWFYCGDWKPCKAVQKVFMWFLCQTE